jgi:glucokinase
VRLATDVKAAAGVEAQQGALRGCDPGLYLNLGTGLAVAIVAGGRVVSGSNGASGEIGYALRRPADVGRGPQERTPLEDVVSGKALFEQAARHLPPGATGAEDVFARAPHDPQVASVLAVFLEELGFHLVNLALALDPRRIAVGGGLVRSWDALHGPLRRALDAALPFPPELVPAAHPYDAPLLGALALGLAAVREPEHTAPDPDGVPENSPEHARIP